MLSSVLLSFLVIFSDAKNLNSKEFGVRLGDKIDICCGLIFNQGDSLYFSKGSTTLGVLNNGALSEGDFQDFLKIHSDYAMKKRVNTICLTKSNATKADDRLVVHCKVTKNSFGRTIQQEELKIKLFEELKFELVPPNPVNVSVGHPVLLQCEASGTPDLEVLWLNASRVVLASGANSANLSIENVTKSMHGKKYTCKATISLPKENTYSNINHTVSLNVLYKPKFVMNTTSFQTDVGIADNVRLTLRGNPRPSLECQLNGTKADRTVFINETKPFTYVYQLEFDNITSNNVGKYECTASNSAGETNKSISLKLGPVELAIVSPNSTMFSNYYLLEWQFLSRMKIISTQIYIDVYEEGKNSNSNKSTLTGENLSPKVVLVGNHENNWKFRLSLDLMNLTSNKLHRFKVKSCSDFKCATSKNSIYVLVPEYDGKNFKVLDNVLPIQNTEQYYFKRSAMSKANLFSLAAANLILLINLYS